ncbi:hypothetical protein LWI29_029301 [Acer saccharum]|uniref:Uncharacterized protein n=1 Tax=Acer saccharum TaxID=4024 RepID=A0AA39VJH1_ACESA|nr:hypothetical protein LWI29_029301 [Acer saccharum]
MIRGIDEKTRRTSRTTWRRENSQLTEALSTACQRYHDIMYASLDSFQPSTSSPPAVIVVVDVQIDARYRRRCSLTGDPTSSTGSGGGGDRPLRVSDDIAMDYESSTSTDSTTGRF